MEITIQQNIPGTDWLFTSVIMRREKKKVKYAKMKQKLKSIFIITLQGLRDNFTFQPYVCIKMTHL